MTIADVLQKEATPQDFLDHINIADWLLRTGKKSSFVILSEIILMMMQDSLMAGRDA